jgi:hypothetical protein
MSAELSEDLAPWILEAAEKRAAAHRRRQTIKKQQREQHAAARTAGLITRHAAKLARSRKPSMLF